MKIPGDLALLQGAVSIHPVIDWPRFVLAMLVFGGMLTYMVYALVKRG